MTLKRGKTFAHIIYKDWIFIDGLNENVDVFKRDSFTLEGTLETEGNNLICAIVINESIYLSCQNKTIYVYDVYSQKLEKMLSMSYNTYCFLQFGDNHLLCGQRIGNIDVIDLKTKEKI